MRVFFLLLGLMAAPLFAENEVMSEQEEAALEEDSEDVEPAGPEVSDSENLETA